MTNISTTFKTFGPHELTIGDRAQLSVTEQAITIHVGHGHAATISDDGVVIILPSKVAAEEQPQGVEGPTPFAKDPARAHFAKEPARTRLFEVPALTVVKEPSEQ